jgi:Zn ribbon nucleic-acid-binding protein
MSQTQLAMPLCPMCHMAMRLMLVKETGGRKLRCMDCGQPNAKRRNAGVAQGRTRHSEVEVAALVGRPLSSGGCELIGQFIGMNP